MIIDMHMHEMRYSGDSFLRLENMVEIAKHRKQDFRFLSELNFIPCRETL